MRSEFRDTDTILLVPDPTPAPLPPTRRQRRHRRRRSVLRSRTVVGVVVVGAPLLGLGGWSLVGGSGDRPTPVRPVAQQQTQSPSSSPADDEYGVSFTPGLSGRITGVDYYDDGGAARPVASLWTSGGRLLGRQESARVSTAGWRRITFTTPVRVVGGRSYVVSLWSASGRSGIVPAAQRHRDGHVRIGGVYVHRGKGFPASPVSAPTSVPSAPAGTSGGTTAGTGTAAPSAGTGTPATGAGTPGTGTPSAGTPSATGAPAPGTGSDVPVMPVLDPDPAATAKPSATPTTSPAGSATGVAGTGTLAATAIPQPGQVGYTGSTSGLKVIDGPGTAPAGSSWSDGFLTVTDNGVVLDHVYVKGGVYFTGTGTLTIRNSVIEGGGSWMVVAGKNLGCHLDVRDSTLRWRSGSSIASDRGNGAIHGDCTVTAVRNDISGTADGIQNGPGDSLFQQNYIHDLALVGTYPNNTHNDGIQFYSGPNIRILYNRIQIGFDGTHQNAALFFQPSGGDAITAPVIVGNYLQGGGYTLRLESGTVNATVKDNTFGPLGTAWGEAYIRSGASASVWSGNTTSNGSGLSRPATVN